MVVVFVFFQVCENQQNDLQLLQLNLESAHETLREKSGPGLGGRWVAYEENTSGKYLMPWCTGFYVLTNLCISDSCSQRPYVLGMSALQSDSWVI